MPDETTPAEAPQTPVAVTPPAVPPRSAPEPTYFTSEDIEKARQQEKDKVYGRVDSLQERLDALLAKETEREEQTRLAAEAAAEDERKRLESETDVRTLLEQEREERRKEVESLRLEAERERAMREQESKYAEFTMFKQRAVAEAATDILPELVDYVQGNTIEEVQQSIADLKTRSEQIINNATEALTAQRQNSRTVQATGGVASDILATADQQNQLTPDKIAAMTPQEWGKVRGQFGIGGNGRGIFG